MKTLCLFVCLAGFSSGLLAADSDRAGRANRLIHSDSPYLLQHAYNPVDWYPWGAEAFARARKENRPIFLSIGYSTCYWCHVMARESFENVEIAALLNRYFIAIKVDREERPDIDAIYMAATRLISGHGGWPMTVFLDHQLRPFHAATYYPPYATEHGPGLKDILLRINRLWREQPWLIEANAKQVTEQLALYADDTSVQEKLAENIMALALQEIRSVYDAEYGGFSNAPKFPRPGIFSFLNRLARYSGKDREAALEMMQTTLEAMAAGGIFDQLGGGFHRYAVDAEWQVPHFEKMLYTQAMMVMAYSDLYRISPQPRYRQVVAQTLAFVLREMCSPGGGFYSALDADSERPHRPGERGEGAYYLWTLAELKKLLDADELDFAGKYFHLREQGNIDSDPRNEFVGLNILYIDEDYSGETLTPKQQKLLASARNKLERQRQLRPAPHRDDKIITAWNGMMIAALARAAQVFEQPRWLQQAISTARFVEKQLQQENGSLLRHFRSRPGETKALLEDYAWLIYGLLEIHQASEDADWLRLAVELQKQQDRLFLDKATGAYFEAAADDAALLFRFKSILDDALPSANAISLDNLRRLARLAGSEAEQARWSRQADRLLGSFAATVNRYPSGAAMLLSVEVEAAGRQRSHAACGSC